MCIKLFLDGGQKLPDFLSYKDLAVELHKHSRSVESAIADYLQCVRQHVIATLTLRWSAGFMRSTKIEWVMTVPAIWTDRAKDSTLQAAKQAGLSGKITMISEVSSSPHNRTHHETNHDEAGSCCRTHVGIDSA